VLLSAELAEQHSGWRKHVNGHVLIATDTVLDYGVDVTAQFR
jgi:hypothetical protein